MASPTESPIPGPGAAVYASITINAGAHFERYCVPEYVRIWLGDPIVGSILLQDIESTDRLINELCEALAYMRHESANAKRCEARGAA